MINLYIAILVGANLFITGLFFGQYYQEIKQKVPRWTFIPAFLFIASTATFFMAAAFVWFCLVSVFNKVDRVFQISFFYQYYFTKKHYHLHFDALRRINLLEAKLNPKKPLRNKIYRYCIKLVNKRNNYTFTP